MIATFVLTPAMRVEVIVGLCIAIAAQVWFVIWSFAMTISESRKRKAERERVAALNLPPPRLPKGPPPRRPPDTIWLG